MRKMGLLLALLPFCAALAFPQAEPSPSNGNGPVNIKIPSPTPDSEGVYRTGPGIVAPVLASAVPASDSPKSCTPSLIVVSAVIGRDGIAKVRDVRDPNHNDCEALATSAVEKSSFQPGTLNGRPVPVLVCVGVPFLLHIKAPTPQVQPCPEGFGALAAEKPIPFDHRPPGMKPPVVLNQPEAEYSDEAKKEKIQGIVLVSAVINTEGLPTDLRVLKSLGYGLDEEALLAVKRFLFQPATLNGKPVPAQVTIEVNFKIRKRHLF